MTTIKMAWSTLALAVLCVPIAVRGAGLEDQLNARWRGGTVVTRLAMASSCDDYYNDNEVVGNRADSKARRRFTAGETARVERVGVHRGRIDVFLDLNEGVLEEIHDGPFTLYEPRTCKVQLKVPVPDRWSAEQAEARLAELLELHGSVREAEASSAWNKRRREPFPPDYEKTLAAYEVWKAAQKNAAIQARMEAAVEEASRIGERVHSDADYLQGFAAGMERGRDRYFGDCGSLAAASFYPDSGKGSSEWKRGYEDGQRLGWDLTLLRRLKECFVPVPAG
ncbi:MAG TPA: hypothetical protein VGX68_08385 [Thermoanaerobaculia bacterium]|jgi:hypothetical protein|nr:hypothetical protein [Thermoanaerobaculia bacterium]